MKRVTESIGKSEFKGVDLKLTYKEHDFLRFESNVLV